MASTPSISAFIADAHTLLTVVHGVACDSPAPNAACLAGACPTPAVSTFPKNTSSTLAGEIPARATASLMATAPSAGALKEENTPPKGAEPMGVRAMDTIHTSGRDDDDDEAAQDAAATGAATDTDAAAAGGTGLMWPLRRAMRFRGWALMMGEPSLQVHRAE